MVFNNEDKDYYMQYVAAKVLQGMYASGTVWCEQLEAVSEIEKKEITMESHAVEMAKRLIEELEKK